MVDAPDALALRAALERLVVDASHSPPLRVQTVEVRASSSSPAWECSLWRTMTWHDAPPSAGDDAGGGDARPPRHARPRGGGRQGQQQGHVR